MSLMKRVRLFAAGAALLVLLAACTGGGKQGPKGGVLTSPATPPPPPVCPLTGDQPASGEVPDRPVLAVKVENLPSVRPQTGLSFADMVYEEPVEGGITRFIVLYQCKDASRIEPIRSARLTDPGILTQFGRPLFAYAGGVQSVFNAVKKAGLIDINYTIRSAAAAYHRDSSRAAPHNLYSSTKELYGVGRTRGPAPNPVFKYSEEKPKGRRAKSIHLPFSYASDVFWKYDADKNAYLRFHGTVPHTYSDGTQVAAKNVVVQVVRVVLTGVRDRNGQPSPEVISVGSGKAYVLRGGRVSVGTWRRPTVDDITTFYDKKGNEVTLLPGTTWVELFPSTLTVTIKKA